MALTDILNRVGEDFAASHRVDAIWSGVPEIIAELRSEFVKRLQVNPEIAGISLVLAELDPQLAYGTNTIIFDLYFPSHLGLRIRCECCLEHPNAKVSVRKQPEKEVGAGADAAHLILKHSIGNTFEANLLRIG